ncbi:hypothetical protein BT63DRAFT_147783 [Microthyrium microscopicum]|uniref:Uncharacterized protein n=1 Tax=Microthyrium microscopicum TaxID=703497 RepID=A0A6A6UQF4_9PEZI|nr:hypothetical protein BT63DRAFT_147783 [Microthyrium microscopicum]
MAPLSHPQPASMNYSNMIEEKNLKKTFIIATLVSTLIGTFTTGIGLYDRIGEKRKQGKIDKGQNVQLKELQAKVDKMGKEGPEKPAIKERPERGEQELQRSLEYGGPMIRQEYNHDLARLGPRFANGDAITQNQLQSQIITLQGTVIGLLEDAVYTGRLDNINKLYNASEFAREGSLNALRGQYQRMLQAAPVQRPIGPVRRISSTPTIRSDAHKSIKGAHSTKTTRAPSKAPTRSITEVHVENDPAPREADKPDANNSLVKETAALSVADHSGPLFCRYAVDLQETSMPLEACFSSGGSGACPLCGTKIGTEAGRAWKIDKEVVHERVRTKDYDDEVVEERTFLINNRFVVKSHREKAGFACVLCYNHRERDTICESVAGLVRHVWQRHDVSEFEAEPDIREVSMLEERVTQKRDR